MIDVTDDGNVLVVAPAGELDLTTSPQLVEAFASKAEHTALVCDVARVTFIDSTGIQALLALQRDEPDRFALDRSNWREHVAFGAGPHVCPGASLARLEGQVLLETFLDRVGAVTPAPGWVPRKTPVFFANGPIDLPVRVVPAN